MPKLRTLALTGTQRAELVDLRDHGPKPYLRERAALLKIAAGARPAHADAWLFNIAGVIAARSTTTNPCSQSFLVPLVDFVESARML